MRIAVLGAGAWGTSIASVLGARLEVTLWARDAAQARAIEQTRRNERYLPGIPVPASVVVSSDLSKTVAGARLVLAATPVAGLRELLGKIRSVTSLVWLCKGFEEGSGALPHQIAAEVLGEAARCGALSGPSFAEEVARGLPCALTLASRDAAFARETAALLHGGRLRVYYSADLVGAALGGAPQTFMGLAGAGDLILTATGDLSRNRRVGLELAQGRTLHQVLKNLGHVAEGVRSANEVARLAAARGVDMPVTDAVNAVLAGKLTPAAAVERLLSRDPKKER